MTPTKNLLFHLMKKTIHGISEERPFLKIVAKLTSKALLLIPSFSKVTIP